MRGQLTSSNAVIEVAEKLIYSARGSPRALKRGLIVNDLRHD